METKKVTKNIMKCRFSRKTNCLCITNFKDKNKIFTLFLNNKDKLDKFF